MKRKVRMKYLRTLLALLMTVCLIPVMPPQQAKAADSYTIDLGATAVTSGKYTYPDAVVSGDNIRTILISFSGNVASGDSITLPSAPSGFTVSGTSNAYAKRINLDSGTTASAVQDYLRQVGFSLAGDGQSIEVTVTSDSIGYDTYYNSDTEHYYQYISDSTKDWKEAYSIAKDMTYMGRKGYLATVTSLKEDSYLNSLSGGKTGWLGGTILKNSGSMDANSRYYTDFNTSGVVSTGWYWACGPEIGTTFYNVNSLYPNADSLHAAEIDANNTGYYNWTRVDGYEPNNQTTYVASNHNDYETCLTTLVVSGKMGKHGTSFTWNDIKYNGLGSGDYTAKGYFVEYGNEIIGDSGSSSTGYASASKTISKAIKLTDVTWTDATAYTCDVNLPVASKMVTISVDNGYFTLPDLSGSVLTFLGGTSGTTYIGSNATSTHYSSAVLSYTNTASAEALLDDIIYTTVDGSKQTITATASMVAPLGSDLYFEGHFYRYVTGSINWKDAVIAAGGTTDPYFGGRGYLATATSQPENSILLKIVDNGGGGDDHWNDAWMGGLWQRNTADNITSPVITRGTNGNEINYSNISSANTGGSISNLLLDYTLTYPINTSNSEDYIHNNSETVRYYWVDGPEAGEEIPNNTAGFAPWHATDSSQDEPNVGDFIYIGWQGAYWDDFSAYSGDNTGLGYAKQSGYIVEFSGFGGGSTANIITNDTSTVYPATVNVYKDGNHSAALGTVVLKQNGTTVNTVACVGTGIYKAPMSEGTYDVYINGEDTGKNITVSSTAASVDVNYYTVNYSLASPGTVAGSTIAATAGGTSIESGTAVLAGKKIIITAGGSDETATYSYLWSGNGTHGETTASVEISSISSTVEAACTVKTGITGTVSVSGSAIFGGVLNADTTGVSPLSAVTGLGISYQWFYSASDGGSFNEISGATDSSYTISDPYYAQKYIKLCITGITANGYNGSINSSSVLISNMTQVASGSALFLATGYDTGILYHTTTDMEYSLDGGIGWTACTGSSITLTGGITPVNGIRIRTAAKEGYDASDVQNITVDRANAAPAPTLSSRTDTTITITTTTGNEYSINDGMTWVSSGTGRYTFTGLTVGTSYHIVQRVKAHNTTLSSDNSPELAISSKTIATQPSPIVVLSVTDTSITIQAQTGCEYSCDGGITWRDSNIFTGLTASTIYHLAKRYKETDETSASTAVYVDQTTNNTVAPPNSPTSNKKEDDGDLKTIADDITKTMEKTGRGASEEDVLKALGLYEKLTDTQKKDMDSETLRQLDEAIKSLNKVSIVVENDTGETQANVTDQTGLSLIITKENLSSGKDIVVTLKVKELDTTTSTTTQLEERAAQTGVTIGGYLDVTLFKKIGSSEPERIESTGQPIKVTLEVPKSIKGYGNYIIYRDHLGKIAELYDLDSNPDTVTFETDLFSTYVIAYSGKAEPAYTMDGKKITLNGVTADLSEYMGGLSADAEVTYHSCSHTIVAVSDDGVIRGLKKGKSVVTVIVKQAGEYYTFSTIIVVKKATKTDVANTIKYREINYIVTGDSTCAVSDNRSLKLSSITIPDYIKNGEGKQYKVTGVEGYAFLSNKKIKKVTLGSNVQSVEGTSFAGCSNLETFKVSSKNKYLRTAKGYTGMLLSKDGKTLITYAGAKGIVKIPVTVQVIGDYAFAVSKVTGIVIPKSMERINPCAFAHCTKLESVSFEGELVEMPLNCIFDRVPASCKIKVQESLVDSFKAAFETAVKRGLGQFKAVIEAK